ncbi:MAG: phage major capsid protein [Nocardioides sp.]
MSANAIALLRKQAAVYTRLATQVRDDITLHGGGRPTAEQSKQIENFTAWATACSTEANSLEGTSGDRTPQYKHSMTDLGTPTPKGGFTPGGGLPAGAAPPGTYSLPLSPEQKVADALGTSHVSEEAILGALGVIIKAQAVPVDRREAETWGNAIGVKDMAESGGAGVLVPAVISGYLIDLLRSQVVTVRLGARTVPMSSKTATVPRITGDVTAAWLDEGALLTASEASLDSVTLTARRLDCGTKVSMELEEDSDPVQVGQVVAQSISAAFALKIDAALLRGSGTPPEPQGIRFGSGVTLYAVAAAGDPMTYDLMLALAKAVAQANAAPTGFVSTPGAAFTLAGLKEATTNAYLAPPPLLEPIPHLTTTSLPINLTKGAGTALTEVYCGQWDTALLGMRTAMSIQTARELYRTTGQIGIFGRMRVATALAHPAAFAVASFVDD